MSTPTLQEQVNSPVWRKALVTVAVVAACLAGNFIVLPTVDHNAQPHQQSIGDLSIMCLGIGPLLSAFLLVELVAWRIRAWAPLRLGGPTARGKLRRAAVILGMILTAGQALVMALGMEHFGMAATPGLSSRLLTTVTLLGAACVMILLAQLVDRHGLGNGFSILILVWLGPRTIPACANLWAAVLSDTIRFRALLPGLLIVVGFVAATLWMFSPCRLLPHGSPEDSVPMRLPACGSMPLTLPAAVLFFFATLAGHLDLWPRLKSVGLALRQGTYTYLLALLVLSVATAAFFSELFNDPGHIANAWRRLSGAAAPTVIPFKPVMWESAIFVVLIVLGEQWLIHLWGAANVPPAANIVIATAVLLDLLREAHAQRVHHNLVSVWEIHRVYAVDPVLRLLAAEGIRCFPRGLHHRTLLQFFGPYVPVHIMVEAKDAEHAQALLQSRMPW